MIPVLRARPVVADLQLGRRRQAALEEHQVGEARAVPLHRGPPAAGCAGGAGAGPPPPPPAGPGGGPPPQPRPPRPRLLLHLEQLEDRTAPTVSLLSHYNGLAFGDSGGFTPPDTCGAAGPTNYLETVNQTVRISNKTSGATIATDSFSHFLYTTGGLA